MIIIVFSGKVPLRKPLTAINVCNAHMLNVVVLAVFTVQGPKRLQDWECDANVFMPKKK